MTGVVATALAVAAALVLSRLRLPRRPGRRLRRLVAARSGRSTGPTGAAAGAGTPTAWEHRGGRPRRLGTGRRRFLAVLAGVTVGGLVGGLVGGSAGVVLGAVVVVAADQLPVRAGRARERTELAAEAAALPFAADLLAVVLRGGAPVDRAVVEVGEAMLGDATAAPLGHRLVRVGRSLRFGGAPTEAWAELAPVPGAGRLVRAAVRSAEHGGALADALTRLAADLRADRVIATEAAARRAGVLIVLPLGVCFLPAFMLAGLVPVIVAVLGDIH